MLDTYADGARALLIEKARASFLTFLGLMHQEESSRPFESPPHLRAIAWMLQEFEAARSAQELLAAPPRFMKSFACSVAFPAWVLGRQPDAKVVCASYNEELADRMGAQTRRLMQSQVYQAIFPDTRLRSRAPAASDLQTTAGGMRFATSPKATLTGLGADYLIVDDPLKAGDEAASPVYRDAVFEWLRSGAMTRFDDASRAKTLVTHQRLHLDDPIGRLKAEPGWSSLELPCRFSTQTELQIGPRSWHTFQPGDDLWRERCDAEVQRTLKHRLGADAFAAQYMQDPKPPGGGLFQLEAVQRFDLEDYRQRDFEAVIASVDSGISTEPGADFTAVSLWGVLGQRVFLLHVQQGRWSLTEQLRLLQSPFYARCNAILIERSMAGIALMQELSARNCQVLEGFIPGRMGKPVRAQRAALAMEQGRVFFPYAAPWLDMVQHQLATFPNGRNDDIVDSISQLFCKLEQGFSPRVGLSFYKPNVPIVTVTIIDRGPRRLFRY